MMLGIEDLLCELKEDINEQGLPPGFRFHPTDEELITFYLASKVFDTSFSSIKFVQVDLNKCEPWDLPDVAKMGEREWYFFSLRDRKYPTGMRTNRATGAGYWKATGKDREIYSNGNVLVGMKKTLVFYKGRAPRGEKSRWVMHEYRLDGQFSSRNTCKEEWVICRIFHKIKEKKSPMIFQGHQHMSSSYFGAPSSSTAITTTIPPLPSLLDSETDPILTNPFENTNNIYNNKDNCPTTFPVSTIQLSHVLPSFTYTPNQVDSKTNNNPSTSDVLIKSLLSNPISTLAATTIPIQCKTEPNFSPFLEPHANLRWGFEQEPHHDFTGLDFNSLGFPTLGVTDYNSLPLGTSSTTFDFNKVSGLAPTSALGESWPLNI